MDQDFARRIEVDANTGTPERPKRLVVIGAVAAGTSAAAKARRNDESLEIVLYECDRYISYSGCGLPYFIGGRVADMRDLTPRDEAFFDEKYRVTVRTGHEVTAIDTSRQTVEVRDCSDGRVFTDRYDTLVLSTGATATRPPITGIDRPHVFTLRTPGDALAIRQFIDTERPAAAVVLGSGFIGLEMVENLSHLGIRVTLVELLPQVCPALDADMAPRLQAHLEKNGVDVRVGRVAQAITETAVQLDDGATIDAGLVIVATGIRPNTALARSIGVHLGPTGAIAVNERMQTSVPNVYACGDCAESFSIVDGQPLYRPLGSTANKMGRIAGDVLTGGTLAHRGIAGTGIFQVFGMSVATTGLSQREADARGIDAVVAHISKPALPEYLQGREMTIKALADKQTERLLGIQIIGFEGVDKRMDVLVTAMTAGMAAPDLFHLDLAYAPPFATTKDPVHYAGMVLGNALERGRELITADKLAGLDPETVQIIDTRAEEQFRKGHVEGAVSIPQASIRRLIGRLDPEKTTVTYCNRGVTGNAVQNILINRGFRKVYNLSGGYSQYRASHPPEPEKPKQDQPAENIPPDEPQPE